MLLAQIGNNRVNVGRKIVTDSFPAGQESIKIIDVVQCSETKEIKLEAKLRGKNPPVIYGAVVRFGDWTYGAIEAGRFLIDGEVCQAKDGDHAGAQHIPAKRLTGVVDSYIWVEWDWGKKTRGHGYPRLAFMGRGMVV